MNRNTAFTRKIIYICLMVVLLLPLSYISRPATRNREHTIEDAGGVISKQRDRHDLSQAKLSEIDPASETMKLVSLGFRGVAVTSLWLKAIDAKKKKDWDSFSTTLNTLIKIQPNFIKVWEYQAHNMSYNVSVEFDDFEQRYNWVKKGIVFLTEGIPYNRRDHRITDALGMFTGSKIGRADEKVQYRRLFRKDDDFHSKMDPYFSSDTYDTGDYGKDNWLLAYQWYNKSIQMVEEGVQGDLVRKRKSDMTFYMWRPAQLRNHVMSLQREYPPEDSFKFKWARAHDEWVDYGTRTIRDSFGTRMTLEGLLETELEIDRLRRRLDELVPGVRDRLLVGIYEKAKLTDLEKEMLKRPFDTLNDEERGFVRSARVKIDLADQDLEKRIVAEASEANRRDAEEVLNQINRNFLRMRQIDKYRGTTNYHFWKNRTEVETTDPALAAHQALYNAREKKRQALYESYQKFDPETGEPEFDADGNPVMVKGSLDEYITAFSLWRDMIDQYPMLKVGALVMDLFDEAQEYKKMLQAADREWPKDHPLQEYIDDRAAAGFQDPLPTSEQLIQIYGDDFFKSSESDDEGESSKSDAGEKEDPQDAESSDEDDKSAGDSEKSGDDKAEAKSDDKDTDQKVADEKSGGEKPDDEKSDDEKSGGEKSGGEKSGGEKSGGESPQLNN